MEFALILVLMIWMFIIQLEISRIDKSIKKIKQDLNNTKSATRQILKG